MRLAPRATDGQPQSRRAGFSLIELVMCMAIVGVLSAIALPRYANSIHRYRADAAARRVVSDLALAKARAQSANASQQLIFNGRSYHLPGVTPLNGPRTVGGAAVDYSVDLSAEPYNAVQVTANFGGDGTIQFDVFGVADSGGTVQVTVGGVTKTVQLNADTGRAEVLQ